MIDNKGQENELQQYKVYVERSIQNIVDVMCAVADGDYTVSAQSERDDVFGSLAMITNVLVNSVRRAVNELQKAMEVLQEESAQKDQVLGQMKQQVEIIERQRSAIQELSTPVLQLWDKVLALPVIGVVDSRRSTDIMERLLSEIIVKQSRFVILDITGVDIVDTKTADHFVKVIKAAELLGAKCILTGIRPAVAQTLVEIGVDLSSIITLRTLQDGLGECMRLMGHLTERKEVRL